MNNDFNEKEYREAFVEENIRNGIAFQIRAIRKRQGLSQHDLGVRTGKAQNVISRLEDPDYGKLTLQTLFTLAKAFDVGLLVKFVSFSELMDSIRDVSDKALAVPSFDEEATQKFVERPSLIEEFSASKFSSVTVPASESPSARSTRASSASNVIDAESLFGRSQRVPYGASAASNEKATGALAAISVTHQSNRANAL